MKLEESFTNPEEIFGPKTKILDLKRNQFVLEPNKTEMHIYYVISGSVASFIEKDGEVSSYFPKVFPTIFLFFII